MGNGNEKTQDTGKTKVSLKKAKATDEVYR